MLLIILNDWNLIFRIFRTKDHSISYKILDREQEIFILGRVTRIFDKLVRLNNSNPDIRLVEHLQTN